MLLFGLRPGEGISFLSDNPLVERAVARADAVGVAVLNKEFSPHLIVQAAYALALTEGAARVNSSKRWVVNLLNLLPFTESQDEEYQDHDQDYDKRND